ncbi:MAG TPA: hypothetical protein VFO77_01495, partial [Actinoplanes sp.]|nr:hypothetical protein [Actinoplanes sp.]
TWVNDPGSWHRYRAWINKVNATDVEIHYYIKEGDREVETGVHRANFVGKPLWLIMNLQMEGSSGAPGPQEATFQARNIYVGRHRAW